ncbi:unnamed protein product [Adineta ricciae]|uniref:Uncharacterized protein n=1 Tax=Adineta ricciae TaxID=249248 RepID=A0A814M9H8_ADIRI|nr:unnamed protein product [Adineta ricciae]CAF1561396.1 unnamed protein product [Adineta ricciae]
MILTLCQSNISFTYGSSQLNEQVIPFHEYLRQHYPIHYQERSLPNDIVFADSRAMAHVNRNSVSRFDSFKRDSRQPSQSNKRMLCFFHAVNCFG